MNKGTDLLSLWCYLARAVLPERTVLARTSHDGCDQMVLEKDHTLVAYGKEGKALYLCRTFYYEGDWQVETAEDSEVTPKEYHILPWAYRPTDEGLTEALEEGLITQEVLDVTSVWQTKYGYVTSVTLSAQALFNIKYHQSTKDKGWSGGSWTPYWPGHLKPEHGFIADPDWFEYSHMKDAYVAKKTGVFNGQTVVIGDYIPAADIIEHNKKVAEGVVIVQAGAGDKVAYVDWDDTWTVSSNTNVSSTTYNGWVPIVPSPPKQTTVTNAEWKKYKKGDVYIEAKKQEEKTKAESFLKKIMGK